MANLNLTIAAIAALLMAAAPDQRSGPPAVGVYIGTSPGTSDLGKLLAACDLDDAPSLGILEVAVTGEEKAGEQTFTLQLDSKVSTATLACIVGAVEALPP